MYCNYPHITIDYGKEAGVIAITGRRKPMFLLFGLDKMLGIQDYSLIFETLEDQDVDTLIDYIDWNASMPFDIISTEGVRKLISISPLPPEEKRPSGIGLRMRQYPRQIAPGRRRSHPGGKLLRRTIGSAVWSVSMISQALP